MYSISMALVHVYDKICNHFEKVMKIPVQLLTLTRVVNDILALSSDGKIKVCLFVRSSS